MNQALTIILLWLVLQAAATDIALRRIPNVLIVSGLLLSLALHLRAGGAEALPGVWLPGMATGFFLFLPLYIVRAMAAGDVKLMAMTGAFAGPADTLQIALFTCLIGGVLALAMLAFNGRWRILWRNLKTMLGPVLLRAVGMPMRLVHIPRASSAGGIPYGVAIALGTVTVVSPPLLRTFA